ncbi:unnamed protein product [Caenorhabditis nigoni]
MQACVLGLYLSTSMMADQYLLAGSRDSFLNLFLSGVFLNGWFMECLVQIVMAVNRFILDQDALTMLFINIEGLYSYSNLMLVSYDIVCTTTSTICYAAVFFSIRNSQKSVASNINRSSQDSKFLLQFVLISIFYVLAWVLFETLPFIVPADQPQWYAVIPFLVTLNCSSNVIIYLALNREIQKSVRTSWLASKISAATVSSQVQSRPATTN